MISTLVLTIQVAVKYFDSDEQRGCFAKNFEDLVMPKDRNYDSVFLQYTL